MQYPGLTHETARETWTGMDEGLPMQSRAEITTRYAKAYLRAQKKNKGRAVDAVVAVTRAGPWSRPGYYFYHSWGLTRVGQVR